MSIQQILKAGNVLCVVPDRRKATAVRDCLELGQSAHFIQRLSFDSTRAQPSTLIQNRPPS